MPLGTGSANGGLSGSAESGSGVTASLTRGTPGATSVPLTLALSAGATLVSWSVQRSPKGLGTWTTIATGLTDLEYTATGLDSESDYDFQADVVVQEAVTSNVVAVATAEALYEARQFITAAYQDVAGGTILADQRCFASIHDNKLPVTATKMRVWGRSYIAGHGPYLGIWRIGGTLNEGAYQGTSWQRFLFGGADAFTPADGSKSAAKYWVSDEMALDEQIATDGRFIIRVQPQAGTYSGTSNFKSGCRPNYGDVVSVARSNTAGDFGSTLAAVQTNPGSWNAGINQLIGGVLLSGPAVSPTRRAMFFGDSVIAGYIQGVAVRDRWIYAANQALGPGYEIVTAGCGGYRIEESAMNVIDFLASPLSDLFEAVVISSVSYNNRLDGANQSAAINGLNAAISACQAAGKRVVLVIAVPACIVGGSVPWTNMVAWTQSRGLPYIETWQAVAEGGVGPMLVPAYTADNVHLLESGQDVMGAAIGSSTNKEILFP